MLKKKKHITTRTKNHGFLWFLCESFTYGQAQSESVDFKKITLRILRENLREKMNDSQNVHAALFFIQ